MRVVFFILGFTVPFPIFVDVSQWELVVQKLYEDGYLASAGMPVPVGLFSGGLILGCGAAYGLQKNFPAKTWLYFGAALLAMMMFTLYASWILTTPRVISLVLPIMCCILLALFLAVPTLVLASVRGFLLGFFALLTAHTVSALYEMASYYQGINYLFNSMFGFQIYQASISYSAVLSIFVCASLYHVVITRRKSVVIVMLTLSALALFLVILGQRKAFVMDLFLMALSLSFYLGRSVVIRGSMSRTSLWTAGSVILIATLALVFSYTERSENLLEGALEQRGGLYLIFFDKLISVGALELLFGFEPGWGGYSNLVIEMILRLGIVGLFLYLLAILCALKFSLRVAGRLTEDDSNQFFRGSRRPVWLFFVLSTLAANIVNMNLQLPYYAINLVFVVLLFFLLQRIFHERPKMTYNHNLTVV